MLTFTRTQFTVASLIVKYFVYIYFYLTYTGKSLSEALIFASSNSQQDDRLFIELQVQYMKIPSSNLGRTCCVQKLFLTFRTIFVHNMFSPCSAKRRACDKDLPVSSQKSPKRIKFCTVARTDFRFYSSKLFFFFQRH